MSCEISNQPSSNPASRRILSFFLLTIVIPALNIWETAALRQMVRNINGHNPTHSRHQFGLRYRSRRYAVFPYTPLAGRLEGWKLVNVRGIGNQGRQTGRSLCPTLNRSVNARQRVHKRDVHTNPLGPTQVSSRLEWTPNLRH